jgi:N-acetylmuramoyl-L-alanine amidase
MRRVALGLLLIPATLQAQAPALRIEAGGRSADHAAVTGASGAAYPAQALAAMSAVLLPVHGGVRALLFGDTLTFQIGSPFFTARGAVHTLALPVARSGATVLLPAQLFTEWLPTTYARVSYASNVLRVSGEVTFPEPVQAAPPTARVVVIDPGHGGDDTGKIGPNGVREKDAALQLSRRLSDTLVTRGYEVHLTRMKDTLVALADRPRLANRWKAGRPAAIFLSIHMNSTPRAARTTRGFETFFLADARTEDEQRVAEMENAAVAFEDGDTHAATEEDVILNGLRNDFWVRASNDLAEVIQGGIATVHTGPDRGVKRAGFTVLVGALMPAVLVEVAFISHPTESRLVADAAFQAKIASAIAEAVARFFDTHEHLWTGSSP